MGIGLRSAVRGSGLPATALALIVSAILLDRVIFPLLEDHRLYWGAAWSSDEKTLFKLSCVRNWASTQDPLFRNHIFKPLNPPGGPRILVMGDSYIWGDGTRNINDLWWRQLARELKYRGYKNIEVLAAGYPGYSTNLEVKAARKLALDLKPDLIIWGYADNDADEEVIINYSKSKQNSIWLLRKYLPNLSLFVDRQIISRWRGFSSLECSDKTSERWELSLLSGKNYSLFKQTVTDMGHFIKQLPVPGLVITLPRSLDAKYCQSCFGNVSPLFGSNNIPFVDLSTPLRPWYDSTLPLVLERNRLAVIKPTSFLQASPANSHPSAALNHFYALRAADYLEQHYRSLLGQKTSYTAESARLNDCMPIFASFATTEAGFDLDYPDSGYLLRMPGRTPYVQLNFDMPTTLHKITVSGATLKDGKIGIGTIAPAVGFDTGDITYSDRQRGSTMSLDLSKLKEPVNSIYITANFNNTLPPNRHLKVRLE